MQEAYAKGDRGKFLASADISHATLRSGDLLEAFYNHFAPAEYKCPYGLAKELQKLESFRQWQRGAFDCETWCDREDGSEEFYEMLQILDGWASDYMFPFHYIGTTDGDGSAFGIWFDWVGCEYQMMHDDWEKDGDVVYILPFFASSIPALVGFSHTNEDLREFLHCELGSGQGVFTLSGQIFWGADIHDHL